MTFKGFALSVAGCPYLFTTGAVTSLPSSSHPLWFGASTTLAAGYLHPPTGRLTERAKPLDGDLEQAPQTFSLHDAPHGSIGALLTWLATRDAVHTTSTPLAATVTAGATSWTVGDGSLFTAPCNAWCEGECVRVTAVSGNTLTVTRAHLGTKAVAHTIDAGRARFPEVFTDLPWIVRRKVALWGVDGAGAATLLWVGFAVRSPSLADDGARFDLSCDPLWVVLRQAPVGGDLGSTRLVGFGRTGTSSRTTSANLALLQTRWTFASGAIALVGSLGPFRSFEALARDHEGEVSARTNALSLRLEAHIARSARDARIDADAVTATVTTFWLQTTWLGQTTEQVTSSARSGTRQGVLSSFGPIPGAAYFTIPGGSSTWCVASLASLPSSWSSATTTRGSLTTTETPALRTVRDDDFFVVLTAVSTADGGELGPRVTGTVGLRERTPGAGARLTGANNEIVLKDPPPLQVIYAVRTDHWVYGLRYSLSALVEDGTADDWDWSDSDDVVAATAGLRVARDWTFDGKRTLGSVVQECSLLHGCSPVLRAGRLALHAWGWPSAAATPAASIGASQILGRPTWLRWQEGLANRVKIQSADLVVEASQAHSRARFGPGRQITVELAGLDDQASPIDDPYDFARGVIGRMELWSEPLGVARVVVPADLAVGSGTALTELELGDEASITEWMLPDGAGGRALTAARGVVISRELDLSAATLTLELILFQRLGYPYAPCAKVDSLISSTVVSLALNYVGGASTYSGGDDVETFAAGDKVELIERDTTTAWSEALTIQSVDVALGRITFTGALSATAQSKIAGSSWIDLRYDNFANCTATQKASWMFVGDDTDELIDATATRVRRIAP